MNHLGNVFENSVNSSMKKRIKYLKLVMPNKISFLSLSEIYQLKIL